MSTKYPGLTISRVQPLRPDALRAIATLVAKKEKVYFFKETKSDGNHWYTYAHGDTLHARTLKELLIVWRLTR